MTCTICVQAENGNLSLSLLRTTTTATATVLWMFRKMSHRLGHLPTVFLVVMGAGNLFLMFLLTRLNNPKLCDDLTSPVSPVPPSLMKCLSGTGHQMVSNASLHTSGCLDLENDISCDKLSSGDIQEMDRAEYIMSMSPKYVLMDEMYESLTHDCKQYIHKMGYFLRPVSEEEKDFPIAFSIMVYKHTEQVERLLRAVWRPTNVYCISIDVKSPQVFFNGVTSIAKCFDNVFVHPRRVDVQWGTYTVLEPELLCMNLLWKNEKKWKYFINLTGQEFPLKTNYELVQILKAYNGANDIAGSYERAEKNRWEIAGEPPYNIQPRKGAVHIVACRGYVDYLLHSQISLALLKWVRKTAVPDEAFFTMLNYNPHLEVPGAYAGDVDDGKRIYLGRYKLWFPSHKCSGRIARSVCIMEIGDLPDLVRAPHLFVNKFFYDHHPIAYDCLEKRYRHKVMLETEGKLDFNTTLYRNRQIVTHHF